MKSIVTICARGGSKGVKGKNLRTLAGLPLITHTLRQAKDSNLFDAFAVSSDSEDILEIARREGFIAILRPGELATDTAGKIPSIRHCVESVEKLLEQKFDICIDLDCTSPLRDINDIKIVFEKVKEEFVSNVITAMPSRRSPFFNMVKLESDNRVTLVNPPTTAILRRQDAPQCFDMNASIYAWKRDVLSQTDKLFLERTALHVMPEERSIDIDSPLDFDVVEMLMERRKK